MNFHWIVLDLYAYDLHKNAEKARVITFLSQILCQKAMNHNLYLALIIKFFSKYLFSLCLLFFQDLTPFLTGRSLRMFTSAGDTNTLLIITGTILLIYITPSIMEHNNLKKDANIGKLVTPRNFNH